MDIKTIPIPPPNGPCCYCLRPSERRMLDSGARLISVNCSGDCSQFPISLSRFNDALAERLAAARLDGVVPEILDLGYHRLPIDSQQPADTASSAGTGICPTVSVRSALEVLKKLLQVQL